MGPNFGIHSHGNPKFHKFFTIISANILTEQRRKDRKAGRMNDKQEISRRIVENYMNIYVKLCACSLNIHDSLLVKPKDAQ
jgi:hypothetical protein